MTVYLRQGSVLTEVGPGGILHSLFSTIAVRLEHGSWGARFPKVMKGLYSGSINESEAAEALSEAVSIKRELDALAPSLAVWNAEDPEASPPWGIEVGSHVKSLAGYWTTTTGRNLVDELIDNLESLKEIGGTLDVVSQPLR
jgi:2,3-bisphosphoglycerate-dependent phosphoglycerate mutase